MTSLFGVGEGNPRHHLAFIYLHGDPKSAGAEVEPAGFVSTRTPPS